VNLPTYFCPGIKKDVMSLLLVIDTALEKAHVALVQSTGLLAFRVNPITQQHASFVQTAIADICQETNIQLEQLTGVVVVNGPGSYTGLRVGLSSAKGICYALDIPLYTLSTLQVMAAGSLKCAQQQGLTIDDNTLLCPMIDARRMEVFTSLYKPDLSLAKEPVALIADENSLLAWAAGAAVIYSGNGVNKLAPLLPPGCTIQTTGSYDADDLASLALGVVRGGEAVNLAYAEPFYLKPFFSTQKSIS
jgi:tRNA threonylcarbamoyladenosine biosynthesis protein TsaB